MSYLIRNHLGLSNWKVGGCPVCLPCLVRRSQLGAVYMFTTPVGGELAGTSDLFSQVCSAVVFQYWNVWREFLVSVTIYEYFGGYPNPWPWLINVLESNETVRWDLLRWFLLLECIFHLLPFLHTLYFSVLVNWSMCRVNLPHLVLILSSTSRVCFGIWHTR